MIRELTIYNPQMAKVNKKTSQSIKKLINGALHNPIINVATNIANPVTKKNLELIILFALC
jgi:hypothetical protein